MNAHHLFYKKAASPGLSLGIVLTSSMKQKLYFSLLLYLLIPNSSSSQAIRDIDNLVSITFHEITTSSFSYTFDKESDELLTRLPYPLSSSNNDFQGWVGQEFFDVFYSDGDGGFNADGAFITIESRFDNPGSSGGANIAGVEFQFDNGYSIFATHLESYFVDGSNYIPLSELNAVDCDLNTWSALGNTASSSKYLRLTFSIQNTYLEITYSGCLNDEYSILINGNSYDESNPSGTEILTTTNGCDSMILIRLSFENCGDQLPCNIYIPNVFSPNQDGSNDYFSIFPSESCSIDDFRIRIFNKWGGEVFYSEEVNFQWNGIFKNQPLNSGVFVWYIQYLSFYEESKTLSGVVTIVK